MKTRKIPEPIDVEAVRREADKQAVEVVRYDRELQEIVNAWCSISGRDGCDGHIPKLLHSFIREFGAEKVMHWCRIARENTSGYDTAMIQYVSGIRRRVMEVDAALQEATPK